MRLQTMLSLAILLALLGVGTAPAMSAPPKVAGGDAPIVVRTEADVLRLSKPTQVHAIGLDDKALDLLFEHQTLHTLIVQSGGLVSQSTWKKLAQLKDLRFLRISDYEVAETATWSSGMKELRESSLEAIEMHRVYYATQEWLACLADMAHLKRVELSGLTTNQLANPPASPRWKLESLRTRSGSSASGLDAAWLSCLAKTPTLTSLDLAWAKFDKAGCQALSESTSLRSLSFLSCSFVEHDASDHLVIKNGLDNLCVDHTLHEDADELRLGKLISANKPKSLRVSASRDVVGQFFRYIDDWSRLEELWIIENYHNMKQKWSNAYFIEALGKMTNLKRFRLQGQLVACDAVVEKALEHELTSVVLADAFTLSPKVVAKLVQSLSVQVFIIRGIKTLTLEEARGYQSQFHELRKGVDGAKCELHVRR